MLELSRCNDDVAPEAIQRLCWDDQFPVPVLTEEMGTQETQCTRPLGFKQGCLTPGFSLSGKVLPQLSLLQSSFSSLL